MSVVITTQADSGTSAAAQGGSRMRAQSTCLRTCSGRGPVVSTAQSESVSYTRSKFKIAHFRCLKRDEAANVIQPGFALEYPHMRIFDQRKTQLWRF